MKRFFIILCALTIILCSCFGVLSVSAEENDIPDGYTVLNYLDYVTAYNLTDVWTGYAYFNMGPEFFTSLVYDVNGERYSDKGNREWSITLDNDRYFSAHSIAQFPGGYSNNVFLDLSNIPSGSIFQIQAIADVLGLDSQQTGLRITLNSGISYYDSNFNWISDQYSDQLDFIIDDNERFSQLVDIPLAFPDGASYCTLYTRVNFAVDQSNEHSSTISIRFQFELPRLMVSTTYTQMIVQSIINAKLPNGAGDIVSAEDLEEVLKQATSGGFEDANDILNEAPNSLFEHMGAFMFFIYVFDLLITVGWIRSIIMIAFSLGILKFILNLSQSGVNVADAQSRKHGGGGNK